MTWVFIPFKKEFKEAMLSGQKTMTSRTKRYGEKGDIFTAFGTTFKLTRVFKASLLFVANEYYIDEGFLSDIEFIECWKRIHPRKGFDANQMVWVHRFQKRKEGGLKNDFSL